MIKGICIIPKGPQRSPKLETFAQDFAAVPRAGEYVEVTRELAGDYGDEPPRTVTVTFRVKQVTHFIIQPGPGECGEGVPGIKVQLD